jgi:hypothetical protein
MLSIPLGDVVADGERGQHDVVADALGLAADAAFDRPDDVAGQGYGDFLTHQ